MDNDKVDTNWEILLHLCKDEVLQQASKVVLHTVSPLQSKEVRLNYISLIIAYKSSKHVLNSLLFDLLNSKNESNFRASLQGILAIPSSQLSPRQQEDREAFRLLLNRVDLSKCNDQHLLQEHKELKTKMKEQEVKKRKEQQKRLLERSSLLCESIANEGMEMSKTIVEEQDLQRQKLLRVVRGNLSKDVEVRKTWRELIHQLTQERAPWYNSSHYPRSWQLDPTEGPSRMRKRLQRCQLDINSKFFLDGARGKKDGEPQAHPLYYLFKESSGSDHMSYYSFKTNDTIRFLYHCVRVTPGAVNAGEILIGETHVYFVSDEVQYDKNLFQGSKEDRDVVSISWRYDEICEIVYRRYSLQDNALEIFLTSGRTFLLSFESSKCRHEVFKQLTARELPNLNQNILDLVSLTRSWRDGLITTFEYITELNEKAGRSFNDLMQYPVFPFILADYESPVLDLTTPQSFRNLYKPIACQDSAKEAHYVEMYN